MKITGLVAAGWLVLFMLSGIASAGGLDAWAWRFPQPQGRALAAVTYGGGQFVAVGENGVIINSPDGYHWNNQFSGIGSNLRAVAYADGFFATVGDAGVVLISTNAINWTQVATVTGNALYGIAGNSGWRVNNLPQFLAVGDAGAVLMARSGTNWSALFATTSNALNTVTFTTNNMAIYNNPMFLIGGNSGTIMSYSGSGFQPTATGSVGTANNIYCVASAGNGVFAAAGDLTLNPFAATTYLTNQILYLSPNQTRWKNEQWLTDLRDGIEPNLWYLSEFFILTGMTGGPGGLVGVGYTGYELEYHPAVVMTSTNGRNWFELPAATSQNELHGVTYGNGLYVAVGDFGSIVVSANATNWSEVIPYHRSDILAMAANSNLCIAVAMQAWYTWGFASFTSLVSTNGSNWSVTTHNLGAMADLNYNGRLFVGVGAKHIYTTTDGFNWQDNPGFTNNLYGVTSYNGRLVVVGANGSIFTSVDGTNWVDDSVTAAGSLYSVAHGNGVYVAGGSIIATSMDGLTWSLGPSNPPATITKIVYGDGLFVAAAGGEILSSPDGINWQVRFTTANPISGIAYNGGTFLAIAGTGAMFKSVDGLNWTPLAQSLAPGLFEYYDMQDYPPYISSGYYSTVCSYGGTFLAAGAEGNLIQSGNMWNPALLVSNSSVSNRLTFAYTQQLDVPYHIQTSTNLMGWVNIYGGTGSGQPTNFDYSAFGTNTRQFFRIVSP